VAAAAPGTGRWAAGLAAAILAAGMWLQSCVSTTAETQASQAEGLVEIQITHSYAEGKFIDLKRGTINTKGEMVAPPKTVDAKNSAANGLIRIMENALWGYINIKGEMVISPKFENAGDFTANGLARIMENDKWGYINAKGEMVIPPTFKHAEDFAANDLARIFENRKWGYINAKGEIVIPPKFKYAEDFAANGLARILENGKWGYINAKDEMVIPPTFENAHDFAANGLARIMKTGKWGYINTKGEIVIPPKFENAHNFSANAMAAVEENGKWGYINAKGKMVIPPRFEETAAAGFTANGVAEVKENGKQAYINEKGQIIVYIEEINGQTVIRNANDVVIWSEEIFHVDEIDGIKIVRNARGVVIWSEEVLRIPPRDLGWPRESEGPRISDWNFYTPFTEKNNLVSPKTPPSIQIDRDYPKLDGAEALIPIYAAAANAIYRKGKNQNDGDDEDPRRKAVLFSERTPAAYQALIDGRADMIFALAPSEEQKKEAAQKGITYSLTPIAREAFVFLVNEQNPVTSLSAGQIRDIYSGKINDWQEVGGIPKRILAFQRNEGSGSQTAMLRNVMRNTPMRKPLETEYFVVMGGLIRSLAHYDNDLGNAIGYSFRYYATVMHSVSGIRLLAVDGVAPTAENIRNGAYPFTENFYIVTARPLSKNAMKLRDWFLSDEGQQFITQVGYVPIKSDANCTAHCQ